MEFTEDEIYFMRSYAADTPEQLMDMLENARHFATDYYSTVLIQEVMRKVAYITEKEFAQLMKK